MADSSDIIYLYIWLLGWEADKQQRDAETPKKRQIGPAEYVYFTKSAGNFQNSVV